MHNYGNNFACNDKTKRISSNEMKSIRLDRQRIDSLTGARFIAVMIVVFSHFEFLSQYGKFGVIFWNYYHNNATLAVDFFFMLSGFGMMLSSIQRDPYGSASIGGIKGLIEFGKSHVRKIYPGYVFFLLAGIPYYLYAGYYEYGNPLWKVIMKCVLVLGLDLTLLQSCTGCSLFSHSLNGVCWFLSTLFCIYLVSPIIIKVMKKWIKTVKHSFICLVGALFCSFILSILFLWIDGHTFWDDLFFGSPYRRVFYVISGMLVAQIYHAYCNDDKRRVTSFISSDTFEYVFLGMALVWFLVRFPFQNSVGNFVYVVYVMDMVVVASVIFVLAVSGGRISKVFSDRRFVYLGEISMYIFLSHYIIRTYIMMIFNAYGFKSFAAALIEVLIILFLTMVTSVAIDLFCVKIKQY